MKKDVARQESRRENGAKMCPPGRESVSANQTFGAFACRHMAQVKEGKANEETIKLTRWANATSRHACTACAAGPSRRITLAQRSARSPKRTPQTDRHQQQSWEGNLQTNNRQTMMTNNYKCDHIHGKQTHTHIHTH